jgi:glutamate racemase
VLRALRQRLPRAGLLYVADSGHAPYGERGEAYVVDRSMRIAQHLLHEGAAGLVVACNTATAMAVRALRERWPGLPIIGVEPGLKPASAITRTGRIGVLATTGTLASEKFKALANAQRPGIVIVPRPCPGLARLIEQGDLSAPALLDAIEEHCAILREADVDTVVLGCTHYAFVHEHIARAMGPQVRIVDTAEAVARHAASLTAARLADVADPVARLRTTGEASHLEAIAAAWLSFKWSVQPLVERGDRRAA